jgi:hypothetical protein
MEYGIAEKEDDGHEVRWRASYMMFVRREDVDNIKDLSAILLSI